MSYPLRNEMSDLRASALRRRARVSGGRIASLTDAFTLRRCQILLASFRGENAYQIAQRLGLQPSTRTPSTPSTRRGSRRPLSQAPSIRTPFIGPSRALSRLRP